MQKPAQIYKNLNTKSYILNSANEEQFYLKTEGDEPSITYGSTAKKNTNKSVDKSTMRQIQQSYSGYKQQKQQQNFSQLQQNTSQQMQQFSINQPIKRPLRISNKTQYNFGMHTRYDSQIDDQRDHSESRTYQNSTHIQIPNL